MRIFLRTCSGVEYYRWTALDCPLHYTGRAFVVTFMVPVKDGARAQYYDMSVNVRDGVISKNREKVSTLRYMPSVITRETFDGMPGVTGETLAVQREAFSNMFANCGLLTNAPQMNPFAEEFAWRHDCRWGDYLRVNKEDTLALDLKEMVHHRNPLFISGLRDLLNYYALATTEAVQTNYSHVFRDVPVNAVVHVTLGNRTHVLYLLPRGHRVFRELLELAVAEFWRGVFTVWQEAAAINHCRYWDIIQCLDSLRRDFTYRGVLKALAHSSLVKSYWHTYVAAQRLVDAAALNDNTVFYDVARLYGYMVRHHDSEDTYDIPRTNYIEELPFTETVLLNLLQHKSAAARAKLTVTN